MKAQLTATGNSVLYKPTCMTTHQLFHHRALAICIKLFGEEHESTADSYRELSVRQANMHDYASGLQSYQRALPILIKVLGEEQKSTADSYRDRDVTQNEMHDYTSALQCH